MAQGRHALVLQLTTGLDAPRELVFRALTDPAALATWWGPAGFTTPEIELDLEVGGGPYRFGMQPPDGDLFHLTGVFIEVDPPLSLAYSFRWEEPAPDDQDTMVRLKLDASAYGTELSLWQGEFATAERLALHENGWTDSLVKLRRFLGSRT